MLIILSTIIGLLSSLLPTIIQYMENSQRLKHELEIAKYRQTIEPNKLVDETSIITQPQQSNDNSNVPSNNFIIVLRESVRPIVTYGFFFSFIAFKIVLTYLMISQGINIEKIGPTILDDMTVSIIAWIFSFWFGSRTLEKYKGIK